MTQDKRFIQQIKDAISRILLFTENMESAAELQTHSLAADAVIMNFILIAETVQKLSESCKLSYPDIQWSQFKVAENKIGNINMGIDYEYAWKVIKKDLPELQNKLS